MKKTLKIILVILIILLLKFTYNVVITKIIINNYNNQKYNTTLVKSLYFLNFPESYIPYYNEGTILYKQENYNDAINKFEEALNHHPKEKHICDIQINLSLSMLATIDQSNPQNVLNELQKAREVLYQNNCANEEDNNGKSKDSEKLEEEIKKMEEQAKENSDPGEEGNENPEEGEEEKENQKEQEQKEKEIEEKLKEQQKESMKNRDKDMEYSENEYIYNREEKRW